MATEKIVTVINCLDGRSHRPVLNWLKASFDAEFVDHITEPEPTRHFFPLITIGLLKGDQL